MLKYLIGFLSADEVLPKGPLLGSSSSKAAQPSKKSMPNLGATRELRHEATEIEEP